jgi:hypothetical protein
MFMCISVFNSTVQLIPCHDNKICHAHHLGGIDMLRDPSFIVGFALWGVAVLQGAFIWPEV